MSTLQSLFPAAACPGGRLTILGDGFPINGPRLPRVTIGGADATVVRASSRAIVVRVPPDAAGGHVPVTVEGAAGELRVARGVAVATGLHLVDSPAVDEEGRLYVTFSGRRGQDVPVSVFRIGADAAREPFVSGLPNPTSLAFGPDGRLYVSSRFEGTVYRVDATGQATPVVTEVGIPCGLAFDPDGTLYVGDRSGTIFRVPPGGRPAALAHLPPSVAAYHLARGGDGALYVTAPTLSAYDRVYRVDGDGAVSVVSTAFGRPQGLGFDAAGVLHVVEALAGASGLYRLERGREPELVVAGEGLVGVAFAAGALVLASGDTVWRLPALVNWSGGPG